MFTEFDPTAHVSELEIKFIFQNNTKSAQSIYWTHSQITLIIYSISRYLDPMILMIFSAHFSLTD